MTVKAIPEGFNTVSAYIVVKDAEKAIDFYGKAFGAEPGSVMRMPGGNGIMHAELRIGNSTVMVTGENPQWNARSAETLGGSPVSLHIYVNDVDKVFQRALDAGCEVSYPVNDAFWGDRYGKLKDPFGLEWGIATHKEDLSPEEVSERAAEWFASMGQKGAGHE
jgi:PhnB protein